MKIELPCYTYVIRVFIEPMVLITILYCAIAVTLRKQDKMLQCSTVRNRHDHKKRQAIRMSLCVVALFCLFFLPFATVLILWETPVSKSCLYNNLFPISSLGLQVSSTPNPITCFTFVESFRRGLREVFKLPHRKRLNAHAVKTRDSTYIHTYIHTYMIYLIKQVTDKLARR